MRNRFAGDSPSPSQVGSLVLAVLVAVVAIGCQEGPKVGSMGEPVETRDMKINVTGFDVKLLDVIEGDRTHEYDEPVLALNVELTNTGKEAFRYSPQHGVEQASETSAPLLYYDPGEEESLPPSNKSSINISGVVLEKGHPAGQVHETTKIEPGETLNDLFLFQKPDEEQADLIVSIPPKIHRGDKPVLIRIPYKDKAPEGPTWYGKGETADFDGVKFTVTEVETTYVELTPGEADKAFSKDPLLKVTYKIVNDSEEAVTYSPGHHTVSGRRGAELYAGDEDFARVKFSSNIDAIDQVIESTDLESGESLTDFSIFERPGEDIKVLKFEYPASRFGRKGLVRFNLPYEYEEPEKPKELEDESEE